MDLIINCCVAHFNIRTHGVQKMRLPRELQDHQYTWPILAALVDIGLWTLVCHGLSGLRRYCERQDGPWPMYALHAGLQTYVESEARLALAGPYVFVAMHHRAWRAQRHMEYFAQFALLRAFQNVHVVINHRASGPWKSALMAHLFGAINLAQIDTSDARHEAIVSLMLHGQTTTKSTAVIVYPDKHGSQALGDRSMCFRDGLYSAALATGVPVVDILALEPTAARPWPSLVATLVRHRPTSLPWTQSVESYASWRDRSAKSIQAFTMEAQTQHMGILDTYEQAASWVSDMEAQCSAASETDSLTFQKHTAACRVEQLKRLNSF